MVFLNLNADHAGLSDEIERKIILIFALGMRYKDISQEIEDFVRFLRVRVRVRVITVTAQV
ncbi:Uncharacterised protein [Budvicia aquatica]|uniref:Uncharacterized protein n=1 Tax=Budvicia aquatica TaxID=82979 RepID=A0A484ZKU4_9GAMM|nr:Uncharacterised protein [Budvicia aquatica]